MTDLSSAALNRDQAKWRAAYQESAPEVVRLQVEILLESLSAKVREEIETAAGHIQEDPKRAPMYTDVNLEVLTQFVRELSEVTKARFALGKMDGIDLDELDRMTGQLFEKSGAALAAAASLQGYYLLQSIGVWAAKMKKDQEDDE